MVDLERVSYWYPDSAAPALTELNLRLRDDERLLIAGLSGAGKSSLLRVLNGLVPHFYGGRFRGRATIAGMDTRSAGPVRLAERVGMVFQEPQARFLTGDLEDELAFGMEAGGAQGAHIRAQVSDIIDRLELGPLAGRPLDRLSAGEQAKVAIGAALSRRPSLLLMDEPCTELDPPAAQAVVEWVDDLQREQAFALAVADHHLARWLEHVDRVALLEQPGRLEADGPATMMAGRLAFGDPAGDAARALGHPADIDRADLARLLTARAEPVGRSGGGAARPRLRARGLTYAYNGRPALAGADVEIGEGEIVGLVGRNGSGKTTLLRCLMGLTTPASGEVWLDGASLHSSGVAERARHMGYVPQAPGSLLFADSVESELTFTLTSHGLEAQPPRDPAALLELLGLWDVRRSYPRDLSAGQRQRVALAAVLVTCPTVVLLDEPTLGMDPRAQGDLGRLLRDMAAGEGVSVLVASHDVEFLAAWADRLVVLDGGRVVAGGPPPETLFGLKGFRTVLQRWTGRPWPASPRDLLPRRG